MSYSNNINGYKENSGRTNNTPKRMQASAVQNPYLGGYRTKPSGSGLYSDRFERQYYDKSQEEIEREIAQRKKERLRKNAARRKKVRNQRIGAAVVAAGTLLSSIFMTTITKGELKPDTQPIVPEPKPYVDVVTENEYELPYEIVDPSTRGIDGEISIDQDTIIEEPVDVSVVAESIIQSNPEVKEQYDKIIQGLETFSEQLGEDALPLIKERVAELGNGRVDVMDVLKILWIESNGRIYESDGSGNILRSDSDAYGPFQITPDTQDYLNYYYRLNGEDAIDIMNPYDNLDGCIYNLRFLHAERSRDIEEGRILPTGNNLKSAMAWGYHDGAWADGLTNHGEDYVRKFETLSILDEHPEVIEYILNK